MIRELRKYNRKYGVHHPLLAIDFENNPDTGAFICAGVAGAVRHRTSRRVNGDVVSVWTEKYLERYFTDQNELFEFLLSLNKNSCIMVTYNLAYDRFFMDAITDHETVLAIGARVILLKLKTGLKVIDLFNQTMEGGLADWINHLNMTEKWGIVKAELADHYNRVMNDARATYRLGVFIEDFYYYECDVPLQVTVGASALKIFTMKYFDDYWRRDNEALSLYERRAYYGGRVEVFKRGKQKTYSYDVNSMYLSIMRDCLIPDILTAKYIQSAPKKWRRYLTDYLGIWTVTVKTPPDIYIPVLPVRLDGKLKFPRGQFSGTWTSIELLEALAQGYEIISVSEFTYYSQSKYYFRDFAAFIWGKRQKYKTAGNKGMDLMIKRIGNALYGKFAQRNSQDYFGRLSDYTKEIPAICIFMEYRGEVWIHVKGELKPAAHEFPVISAFITAYSRLKLYRAMIANADSLIYVDTDCIKLTCPAKGIVIGNELGEWGLDTDGKSVIYHRPKLYGDKRKGIPKRAKLKCRTRDGETWVWDKPLRYREAITRGLTPNVWIEAHKELTFNDDKRDWARGRSSAVIFNE